MNVRKVTRFRKDGVEALERAISRVKLDGGNERGKAKATEGIEDKAEVEVENGFERK
jgi:hypothetical protein